MKNINKFTIELGSTLGEAITKIKLNRVRTVLVVQESKLIGVLSEGDLLKAFINGANTKNLINQFINIEFSYLEEKNIKIASKVVSKNNINLLPVVNSEMELQEVITIYDVFDEYLNFDL